MESFFYFMSVFDFFNCGFNYETDLHMRGVVAVVLPMNVSCCFSLNK